MIFEKMQIAIAFRLNCTWLGPMCTHLQPPHIYTLAYGMFRSLWKKFTFHEVLFQGSLEGLYPCRSLLERSSCLSFPSQLPFLQVSNIISSPLPAHTFIFFLSVSLGEVNCRPAQGRPLQCWSKSCSFSLVIPCLTSSLISPYLLFPPTCQTHWGLNVSSLNFVFPFIYCPVFLLPFIPFLKACTSAVSAFT